MSNRMVADRKRPGFHLRSAHSSKLQSLVLVLLCCIAVPALASEQIKVPIALTIFANYGSPVAPPTLADPIVDGLGLEVLGEWNASSYGSLGLSFEQTTFYYGSYSVNAQFANFEGRFFPFETGKAVFAPYIMCGAGLSLNGGGNLMFKTALGSRVNFVGPTALDLAVGSHWVQDPGAFQYVDARLGLCFLFDYEDTTKAKPAPSPTPKASPSPSVTPVKSPVGTLTPSPTPTTTPATITLEEPAPITNLNRKAALSLMKATYKKGTAAMKKHQYLTAIKNLKKAASIKEKHVPSYYYAESYADLGLIYHYHMKTAHHKEIALEYYKRALKIDPQTENAKKGLKKLKAELAGSSEAVPEVVKPRKVKHKKAPVAETTQEEPKATVTSDEPKTSSKVGTVGSSQDASRSKSSVGTVSSQGSNSGESKVGTVGTADSGN